MDSHREDTKSCAEQNPRPKNPLPAAGDDDGDGGGDGIHPAEKNAIPSDGGAEEDPIPRTGAGETKHHRDPDWYYTIDISSCTRREREEHKKRLSWELEQVQSMIRWVEASSVGNQTRLPPKKKVKKAEDLRSELEKGSAAMMRKCLEIVNKLMKQRGANWFNAPVDVIGMGLYDYNQIIRIPMDLGTVKANLSKGLYQCPTEFAADVKLTFDNAMLYNPAEHVVHQLAKQLMKKFEGMYYPAYKVYRKRIESDEARKKRAMTEEEKDGLMARLEGLGVDEMWEVMEMMSKRDVKMTANGDEVELEFEDLDNDTLWALEGFLNTRQKKPTNNIVNINNNINNTENENENENENKNKNKKNDDSNNKNNNNGDKMEVAEKKGEEGVKSEKESSSSSSSSSESSSSSSSSGSSSSSSSSSGSDSGRSLVSDPVQQTKRPNV